MVRITGKRSISALLLGGVAAAGVVSGLRSQRAQRISRASGLEAEITINRDRLGVPHIIAASRNDATFGLGFAIAEDRLWQMDLNRRVALGRLSEIIGPDGLESDRMMRLLGMPRIAQQLARTMSAEERSVAESFAAGVNHYIASAGLPAEFRVLRYEPAPWTPVDSMAVFRLLAWTLSGSIDADLTAEQLRRNIGAEWADAIYRGGFVNQPPVVRQHAGAPEPEPRFASRLPIFPQYGASNAWAVGPDRSVTGGALLASDPHLELRNPSIWCEARIEAPGYRIAGATVPGIPAIVIGRTPNIAWGVTAAMTPQVFLYRESIEAQRVEIDGIWQPLRTHDEFIAVKGQADELLHIRYTPRGPLISDHFPQPDDAMVSLHWSGMEEGHEVGVLLDAAAAHTIDDAIPAFRRFTTPPLNVIAADSQHNIASISLGRIALRTDPPGLLDPLAFPPSYLDPNAMPLEINPDRGWVACANNSLVGEDHPHKIYGNWAPGYRYRRIVEVLESEPLHSPQGFRNLQLDVYSIHAAERTPLFVELLEGVVADWVIADLQGWDYQMTTDSRPALLFEAIDAEWVKLALRHRLPEELTNRLIGESGSLSVPHLFVDRVLRGELPAWLDDTERGRLAERAAHQAIDWLTERLGPDTDNWSWGALHRLTFRHPLGRVAGPHRRRVNVGPFAVPGSRFTVWPMVWSADKPFDVYAGPSMRFVTDMNRPDGSWFSNTLGQSGSPFSRHFRNQAEDYLNGFAHRLWPDGLQPRQHRIIHPVGDEGSAG